MIERLPGIFWTLGSGDAPARWSIKRLSHFSIDSEHFCYPFVLLVKLAMRG